MSDDKGGIKNEMLRTLYENSQNEEKGRAFTEDITRRYREAGVSMFGSHPAYPGERIEATADGRWFVIDEQSVRVREVEPQP